MRTMTMAAAVLLLTVGGLRAEEIKGNVKKVDADKSVIVVTVDGKDVEYAVAKDAKFTQASTAKKKKKDKVAPATSELTGGLKSVKDDSQVSITTEKKDGKDVVTAL